MDNKMKEYLGSDYSNDHVRNFCLYWMKGAKCGDADRYPSYDEWRRENDLDCMYLDGDMRADTLMSAWTPIKWVADYLNREKGMKFYKRAKDKDDPHYYLKLLAEDREDYLPAEQELVQLLEHFLTLAELRCNYILLPDRRMNNERYITYVNGELTRLFDEVPAMLAHIYDKDSLGKYFLNENGEHDQKLVRAWIQREHLEMGFRDKNIDRANILPLLSDLDIRTAKWLTDEQEIKEALLYMIKFLEMRKRTLEFVEEEHKAPDSELQVFINSHKDALPEYFSLEQPSDQEIAELEQVLGFSLPEDYRWFLHEFGAGGVHFEIYGYVDGEFTCLEPTLRDRADVKQGIAMEQQMALERPEDVDGIVRGYTDQNGNPRIHPDRFMIFSGCQVNDWGLDADSGEMVEIGEDWVTNGSRTFCEHLLLELQCSIVDA
ncbi:MAG: SMI1/KNR4 family protein [Lachnospiraceae bacterium]|nr:SMI1/KNR4 family protein [Lachnospiraceae bacterium]